MQRPGRGSRVYLCRPHGTLTATSPCDAFRLTFKIPLQDPVYKEEPRPHIARLRRPCPCLRAIRLRILIRASGRRSAGARVFDHNRFRSRRQQRRLNPASLILAAERNRTHFREHPFGRHLRTQDPALQPQVPGFPAQTASPDASSVTPFSAWHGAFWVTGQATIEYTPSFGKPPAISRNLTVAPAGSDSSSTRRLHEGEPNCLESGRPPAPRSKD